MAHGGLRAGDQGVRIHHAAYPENVGHDGAMSAQTELGWADCTALEQDPQRVSGAWVFRGTRIPVSALFENLGNGVSMAEFVELFPGVTEEQARVVAEAWSVQSRSRNC
jgi:uncharacterized protein (DUF433 family)